MNLETPLSELDWLPPQRLRQLERFGLGTVEALLTHFPRRYEDRTRFDRFPTGENDEPVCVCGIVKKSTVRRIRGSQKMFDVVLEEEQAHALSQPLVCRWFNAHWVEKMILIGQRLVVYGRPKRSGSSVVIAHPEFEVVEDDAEKSIHLNRLVPIHRATEGLSARVLRQLIWDVLSRLESTIEGEAPATPAHPTQDARTSQTVTASQELCPPSSVIEPLIPAALDPTPRAWALRQIHFPDSIEARDKARRHLVLTEFFAMQLCVAAKRAEQNAQPGASHCTGDSLLRRLHESLPFSLTKAQQRTIAEIRADLAAPRPMNRLLHGDVGSGKTLVALSAMLLAVEAGWQAALMAPTQILAEQHYLTFQRLCEPLGIRVALRTAARHEDTAPLPLFAAALERENLNDPIANATRAAAGAEPPGSARVPRAGEGVSPSRTSTGVQTDPGARYAKRRLPLFEQPWAIYAVTMNTLARRCLAPAARTVVLDAARHFHLQRYELFAACVMPDHAHFLLQPWPKERTPTGDPIFWELTKILHSWKSVSAHEINRAENSSGSIWQMESFDRYVRSDRDLEEKFQYILRNPWDAGIVAGDADYPWIWTPEDDFRESNAAGSSSSRDGSTSTRDACAPQGSAPARVALPPVALPPRAALPQPPALPPPPRVLPPAEPQILIGTHALLFEGASFTRLGLAVIDEQHKFGVLQRARLRDRGAAPDVLVMTATPIPRTLTMTLYGDLDVSTLDELPKNRGKIVTAARDASKLPDAVNFIRTHLEAGRQAFVVYPLIDESEKVESKAAAAEFEKWHELLAPMKCELLHGRIAPEEKEKIMARFRRGEVKALIATTVIEVGIDVPNATIMLIENAERFGLAQLHQLRGRIGRGEHKSYCILLRSAKSDAANDEKLAILEKTSDGFEIAEADLRLRGPGDILGTAQSGLPPLKIGELPRDQELMRLARNSAFLLFERDPQLAAPDNRSFRRVLADTRKIALSQVS